MTTNSVEIHTIGDANRSTLTSTELVSSMLMTLQSAGMSISMAALIFAGPLAAGLPRAIAAFVVAAGITTVIVGLRTTIVPVAVITQDAPAIVMVAVTAQLVAGHPATSIADVFVLLALVTLTTGVAMWNVGFFGLGRLVRFLPTTVVGAFMAGTGWLLVRGGADVATGTSIHWSDIWRLNVGALAKFWWPALVFGVIFWLVTETRRLPPYTVGLVTISALGAFYAVATAASSVSAAQTGGWLIGPFPDSGAIRPVSAAELTAVNWGGVVDSGPGIASVVGVSVVALLLNLTGIATQSRNRTDIDQELKATGLASMIVSPLAPAPSFHALGDTMMLNRLGSARRSTTVLIGIALVVLGVVGVTVIGYVPRFLVAGLLIGVGLGLLADWTRDIIRVANRIEQLLGVAILASIAVFGVLPGIGVGIVAACGVFVVRYSRIDPIRLARSGGEIRSRVDRPAWQRSVLAENGRHMRVVELQGYLFFGSVTSLETQLDVADQTQGELPSIVVVDFKNVTGVDVSAYSLIARISTELTARGTTVLLSGMTESLATALATSPQPVDNAVIRVTTLDEALEQGEELLLGRHARGVSGESGPTVSVSRALQAGLEQVEYAPGTVVMAQNAPSDGMLIMTSGQLTAFHISEAGEKRRLRRFGPVTVIGEIGMLNGTVRSAEIVADAQTSGFWLSRERYDRLRSENPDLIIDLHEFMLDVQAARVVELSEALSQSMR